MTRTLLEPARNIPIARAVEVLVVGGGSAGIGAAVTAARQGRQTLLVEKNSMFGGTWTASMQVHATSYFDGHGISARGLICDIIDRLRAIGMAEEPEWKLQQASYASAVHFEPEWMKCILDDVLSESGAELLLHSFCAGAIVEDGRIRGIITESKSGRQAILAQVVIDCSGDADVAAFAGVPYAMGRAGDGKCQPINTTMITADVDWAKAVAFVEADPSAMRRLSDQARATGELTGQYEVRRLGARTMYPGVVYHNLGHVYDIDITKAEDLTRAEIIGRQQVRAIFNFYRNHIPGFENARLAAIAPMIGLRESRRIHGEYMLSCADIVGARKFTDGIAAHHYRLDVHSADGLAKEPGVNEWEGPPQGEVYEVPYRCLLPVGCEQLLVAGRCISADRIALGSARTTVCCMQMGEAAGYAAAKAITTGVTVRNLDGAALKAEILQPAPKPGQASPA